jgi:uncharacterized protein (DUF433 family)
VFQGAGPRSRLLSFENLTESFVLSAIRRRHKLSLQRVRQALKHLESELGVKHPLSKPLYTDGRDLLIDAFGNLLNLNKGGQMEMKVLLEAYLQRIQWDVEGKPALLYPFVGKESEGAPAPIVINPRVQFGRPCLAGTRIPTSIIAQRVMTGDTVADVAEDYGLGLENVEAALRFEYPKRAA